jgi:dephospho-CoA kinase
MSKLIIGLVGPIASGKGTIKKYIVEKYGAKDCRFSTILRDVLTRLSLEINRENLINMSTVLRQNFGQDLLAKVIVEDAKNLDANIVVVDGVRREEDIRYLKGLDGFVLLGIDADSKVRFERLVLRNENIGDDKKTFEDFLADHNKETEITIPAIMKTAYVILDNNGTLTELCLQIDNFITSSINQK